MKHHRRKVASLTLTGGLIAAIAFLVPPGAQATQQATDSAISPESIGLYLPAVDSHLRTFVSALDDALADEPQYSTVRILEDRTGIEVYWHGEPSDELTELLSVAPEGFTVAVVDTPFLPADLRAEAQRLISAPGVEGVGVTPEADALNVMVSDQTSVARRTVEMSSSYPMRLETGTSEPSVDSRHSDTYGAGGALIALGSTSRWCTAGFTAQNSSGTRSMLTAAHCAPVGTSIFSYSNGVSWGTIQARNVTHDAAKVGPRSGGFIPSIWMGNGWSDADSIQPISGSVTPVVGDEICTRGGISGFACGHIVQEVGYSWNFTPSSVPPMNGITGVRTRHNGNQLVSGQGDSGGPGVIYTVGGGQPLKWWAATLTSGHQNGPGPGYCDTVADYPPAGARTIRECGRDLLLTSARQAASAHGLSISFWPGS